jgi:protease I
MKALILAADGFEDSELLVPRYRLLEAGVHVEVAGPEGGEVLTGKHGYEVQADLSFTYINPDVYALVVIPGGKAPETVRLDNYAVNAVKKIGEADKVVAAICHGGQVLISAHAIRDKKATCWQGIRDDLIAAGADYVDQEVVVDGHLVTSRCPDDLPAFCREIFRLIGDDLIQPVGKGVMPIDSVTKS